MEQEGSGSGWIIEEQQRGMKAGGGEQLSTEKRFASPLLPLLSCTTTSDTLVLSPS